MLDLEDTHEVVITEDNKDINRNNGLHVETETIKESDSKKKSEHSRLPVETTEGIPTEQNKGITNKDLISENCAINTEKDTDRLIIETENPQNMNSNPINDAALGLIMLRQERNQMETLFDKYDNSALLPVDAEHQMDYGKDMNDNTTDSNNDNNIHNEDNKNNLNYDSDDTVVLEKEIADSICEEPGPDNDTSPSQNRLTVETTSTTNDETYGILEKMANLMVHPPPKKPTRSGKSALPVETSNNTQTLLTAESTSVSPNKGKVVIRSYKL